MPLVRVEQGIGNDIFSKEWVEKKKIIPFDEKLWLSLPVVGNTCDYCNDLIYVLIKKVLMGAK